MDKLLIAFVWFIDRIRSLVGMVIPLFAEASDFRSWPLWVKVLVHVIILAVILYGLWWLNGLEIIRLYLRSDAPDWLQQIYLPVGFILVYLFSWLLYFFFKAFNASDIAEFPDIAAAWEDAVKQLAAKGISVGDAPLYLVVGKAYSGDDALFLASNAKIEMRVPGGDSPIRVFAGRDAIYVTCPGASTWGRFADALANPESVRSDPTATAAGATITPGQALGGVDEKLQEEFYELLRLQSEQPLTADEQYRLAEIGELIERAKAGVVRRVSLPADDLAIGPKRLAFLCSLIRRDRRPWCPLNGALVLLPWSSLDSDEVCREAVSILATDLMTARQTFQLRYPHFVMVCDLEQSQGFGEFKAGFKKDMLRQRIGQRLPLVPDRPPGEVPQMLEVAAEHIRLNLMASWVMKFLRLDWPPDTRKTQQFVPSYNRKLFQFLHDVYVRGPRLGRLLSRGLPCDPAVRSGDPVDALPLVAGCYLAATGRDERSQAFVAGVFQRLGETQSSVSWSPEALADDRAYRRWTNLIWIIVMMIALVVGYAGYTVYKDWQAKKATPAAATAR